MRPLGLQVIAIVALSCAHPAIAKQAPTSAGPTPLASPGTWISASDYPAAARRFDITGATGFKLVVDATGKPSRCEITKSSGFDVLDEATCRTVMAKAEFTPAHDRKGKAVEGSYSSTVRWQMPPVADEPVTENFGSIFNSIDQTGKITACRVVFHTPGFDDADSETTCQDAINDQSPEFGQLLRGDAQGHSVEVEVREALVFTAKLRAEVMASGPGEEQTSLNIHRIEVAKDGKASQCRYDTQRGDPRFANDFCSRVESLSFDPPFAAYDENGIAIGWHITRTLVRTGNGPEQGLKVLVPVPLPRPMPLPPKP